MTDEHVALVTGYTGESGKALLKELLTNENFKKIILVGRRLVDLTDQPNHEKTVCFTLIKLDDFIRFILLFKKRNNVKLISKRLMNLQNNSKVLMFISVVSERPEAKLEL